MPLHSELQMKANASSDFPSMTPFKRLGGKAIVLEKVRAYCAERKGYSDVLVLCDQLPTQETGSRFENEPKKTADDGFVYLLKSGKHHKIGRSVSAGQRERQLAIQLPERAGMIHSIRTDDPVGIEAYWHKRFESKRKNGEWFELNSSDISAFRRRKFM
jgi:hypothetical protein